MCQKTSLRVENAQVAGLVGRPEKSLESFAACPDPGNPLVAFLGNEGCVPLVSLRSRQCVGDLKMSGTVRTAAFSSDGAQLLTSGVDPLPFPSRNFTNYHTHGCGWLQRWSPLQPSPSQSQRLPIALLRNLFEAHAVCRQER